MIRGLFFALVVLAALAYPRAAKATACTVPNLVVNGQYVDATKLAANFSALAACSSSIDNTNIGAAGIYASQLIPTTVAQAVFGGSQSYTFSNGLTVTGTLTLNGSQTATGSVTANNGFITTSTDTAGGLVVSGTTQSAQLAVSGQSNLNGLTASSPVFSGTLSTAAISNSGLITTGSFTDNNAAVFASGGYVQINSLTPSQCVNTASNDVLGSQPCNYFTLNGLQPTVSLTSTGATLAITASSPTIDLEVANTFVQDTTANTKISAGNVSAVAGGTAKPGLPFTSSGSYFCSLGANAAGGTTYALSYQTTNGGQAIFYANPSVTVSYVCVGT